MKRQRQGSQDQDAHAENVSLRQLNNALDPSDLDTSQNLRELPC